MFAAPKWPMRQIFGAHLPWHALGQTLRRSHYRSLENNVCKTQGIVVAIRSKAQEMWLCVNGKISMRCFQVFSHIEEYLEVRFSQLCKVLFLLFFLTFIFLFAILLTKIYNTLHYLHYSHYLQPSAILHLLSLLHTHNEHTQNKRKMKRKKTKNKGKKLLFLLLPLVFLLHFC